MATGTTRHRSPGPPTIPQPAGPSVSTIPTVCPGARGEEGLDDHDQDEQGQGAKRQREETPSLIGAAEPIDQDDEAEEEKGGLDEDRQDLDGSSHRWHLSRDDISPTTG